MIWRMQTRSYVDVGAGVGVSVGEGVGVDVDGVAVVGTAVRFSVGCSVGEIDGTDVGGSVGLLGTPVGDGVGSGVGLNANSRNPIARQMCLRRVRSSHRGR